MEHVRGDCRSSGFDRWSLSFFLEIQTEIFISSCINHLGVCARDPNWRYKFGCYWRTDVI